jgi:hypothetical protein
LHLWALLLLGLLLLLLHGSLLLPQQLQPSLLLPNLLLQERKLCCALAHLVLQLLHARPQHIQRGVGDSRLRLRRLQPLAPMLRALLEEDFRRVCKRISG